MCLFGETAHCLSHPVQEEALGFFLATMTIGRGDQLFDFGHGEGGEEIRKSGPQ